MLKVVAVSLFVLTAVASAQQPTQQPKGEQIPIVRYETEGVNADGSYRWSYETGNGINAEETGQIKNVGAENEGSEVQGSYSYTAPDGSSISITYIANEDGFQPQGDHIPTPPPIPEAIQKALEWIQAHPEPEDATRSAREAFVNAQPAQNARNNLNGFQNRY